MLNLFEDIGRDPFGFGHFYRLTHPDPVNMNIKHDKENYYVRAVVPGFSEKELQVNMDGNILTISGKREETADNQNYYKNDFTQSVRLEEDCLLSEVQAEHKDGILLVKIPRKMSQKSEPRTIPIESKPKLKAANK